MVLATEIRKDTALEKTPILMVTTRSVKDDIMEVLQAGVGEYLIKPFSPNILGEKIEKVLGRG